MQSSSIPTRVPLPFASSGSKNAIPTASQIGITDGAASLTDGFPPLTFVPIAAGGIGPDGMDVNGILNLLSANTQWANAGAMYPYDSTFSTAIGGYPQGAILSRADATGYWISLAENNTLNPDTDISGVWFPVGNSGVTSITLTNANVTLTPLEYSRQVVYLSGTLTGNVNIIFPVVAGMQWIVVNATSGSYSVTCKTSGTGVAVTQGTNVLAFTRGTNLEFLTLGSGISQVFADSRYVLSGADSSGNNVLSVSADTVLTAANSGKIIKSTRSGQVYFTLPGVSAGLNFTFLHNSTYSLVLIGSTNILGSAGGSPSSSLSLVPSYRKTILFCDGTYWRYYTEDNTKFNQFTSTAFTWAANTIFSYAHGLGSGPYRSARLVLHCLTGELGHSAGDWVYGPTFFDGVNHGVPSISVDSTNVYYAGGNTTVRIITKVASAGADVTVITPSKWECYLMVDK